MAGISLQYRRERGSLGDKIRQLSPQWDGLLQFTVPDANHIFHATVSVSSGSYHTLSHILAGLWAADYFSQLWWLEFTGPAWGSSGEDSHAGLQTAGFSLHPHMGESRESSVGSLARALIPLVRAPPSWLHDFSKALPPNTLEARISATKLGGGGEQTQTFSHNRNHAVPPLVEN